MSPTPRATTSPASEVDGMLMCATLVVTATIDIAILVHWLLLQIAPVCYLFS